MATRGQVERFATANREIRRRVTADLRTVWPRLPDDPTAATAALLQVIPDMVAGYGDLSAAAAADYYDDLRAATAAPGRFVARLAGTADPLAVAVNVRWAVGPLFGGARADALGRLTQVTDRMSLQPGRDTIDRSVRRDPAKPTWARVPTGITCAFCTVLASRGPVYGTEQTAGGAGNQFHARCDCTPTPVWRGDDLPDGYDPEALYNVYEQARASAGSGSLKAITAELRKLTGLN